jgi:CHAT domain-containing protein
MTTWNQLGKLLLTLVFMGNPLFVIPSLPSIAQSTSAEVGESPDRLLKQGIDEYAKGNLSIGTRMIQNAIQGYRQRKDLQGESHALKQLGEFYLSQKDYETAIAYARQNLILNQGRNDRQGIADSLSQLGLIYHGWHRYQSAIGYQRQSLTYYRETKDLVGQGMALYRLGEIYHFLGNYPKALEYHQQSLTLHQQAQHHTGIRESLHSLGKTYQALEEPQKAIDAYQQSLAIAESRRDPSAQGSILGSLGNLHESLGNLDKAIVYYDKSLTLAQNTQDLAAQGQALSNRANAYLLQGNIAKAIEYQQKNFDIQRLQLHSQQGQAVAYHHLGRYHLQANHLDEAAKYLRHAIYLGDALRTGLADANKVSFAATQANSYQLLQKVLVRQNRSEFALEIAERGRGQSFADRLSYRSKFASGENVAETTETQATPLNLNQIFVTALRQKATIVQYSIVDRELYIWVIKAQGTRGTVNFQSVNLDRLNITIENLVTASRRAISLRSANPNHPPSSPLDLNPELRQLHQLLIEPIAQHLPKDPNQRVIFIPQGSLFLVPFAALKDSQGKYLIEQHTLSTAPSIQTLAFGATKREQRLWLKQQRQQSREKSVSALIVGNPVMPKMEGFQLFPLPHAEQEAKMIAKMTGNSALIGSQATKATVLDRISQVEIIHFATHGLLDDLNSDIPGAIAFTPSVKDTDSSNNGFLTAREVLDLKINANLVVLSACDTGRGNITGDGVIGLSRSFFIAGAPSVIVSLWAVNDASTAFLMNEFYHQFHQRSSNKAQALRQAMLITMKKYTDPIDWAAFTLMGEAE